MLPELPGRPLMLRRLEVILVDGTEDVAFVHQRGQEGSAQKERRVADGSISAPSSLGNHPSPPNVCQTSSVHSAGGQGHMFEVKTCL